MTLSAHEKRDVALSVRAKRFTSGKRMLLTLYAIFVVAVLVEPAYFSQAAPAAVHRIFSVCKYFATGSAVLLFFLRRSKLNKLLIGGVAFEVVLLFTTMVNSASLSQWVRNGAYTIALLLFLQVVMDINAELLLRALSITLGAYVNINTLTWLLYPKGMYTHSIGYQNCWFLGYDNVATVIIVVAITVCLYRILLYPHKWLLWDWIAIISGTWFTFASGVANAIVAETALFLFLLLTKNKLLMRKIGNASLTVTCMLVLFALIHLYNIQEGGIFGFIFTLLGKTSTFNGRTFLWSKAWADIKGSRWLFGFGVHTSQDYVMHFGSTWHVHLHCYYLQVLYEGGLLAFGMFLGWLYYAAVRFDKTKHTYSAMALLAGLLAVMFMWQVEANNNLIRYFIIILILLYNASKIEAAIPQRQYCRIRFVINGISIRRRSY